VYVPFDYVPEFVALSFSLFEYTRNTAIADGV
jgi:hypothetical protein